MRGGDGRLETGDPPSLLRSYGAASRRRETGGRGADLLLNTGVRSGWVRSVSVERERAFCDEVGRFAARRDGCLRLSDHVEWRD